MMKTNMGTVDRIVRIIIAITVIMLSIMGYVSGIPMYILLVLSGIFLLTGLFGFCPLYWPLGISTHRKLRTK